MCIGCDCWSFPLQRRRRRPRRNPEPEENVSQGGGGAALQGQRGWAALQGQRGLEHEDSQLAKRVASFPPQLLLLKKLHDGAWERG